MRCTSPRRAGYGLNGSLVFKKNLGDPEFGSLTVPCGKCLGCRIDRAAELALRCVNEASGQMDNSFITLTYDEEHYYPKLQYEHLQKFFKNLRHYRQFRYLAVGEYGEKYKRPHWHLLMFGLWFDDTVKTGIRNGYPVYQSKTLLKYWQQGKHEIGPVVYQTAAYTAAYALKKLSHGWDQNHDYHPIVKSSLKPGLGYSFFKRNLASILARSTIVYEGKQFAIPRYYLKVLKRDFPDQWRDYQLHEAAKKQKKAYEKAIKEQQQYEEENFNHYAKFNSPIISPSTSKKIILNSKQRTTNEDF